MAAALGLLPIIQIPWVARLLGPSERDATGFGRVMCLCRDRINARFQARRDRSDMLASFARHGLGTEQLVTEAVMQLVAGSDTTSTAVRSVILYVLASPRVYSTLQAEVDAAVASGKAPAVPGIISDAQAKTLPYLQACIKEGMRVHPPTTGLFPKRVPDGGDMVLVDGKPVFLPGGTNVGYARNALLLDKRVYGEDAAEYRPERWLLKKDGAKLAGMLKSHDLIFGYGRYQCLGKSVALTEISKTIFEACCTIPILPFPAPAPPIGLGLDLTRTRTDSGYRMFQSMRNFDLCLASRNNRGNKGISWASLSSEGCL